MIRLLSALAGWLLALAHSGLCPLCRGGGVCLEARERLLAVRRALAPDYAPRTTLAAGNPADVGAGIMPGRGTFHRTTRRRILPCR